MVNRSGLIVFVNKYTYFIILLHRNHYNVPMGQLTSKQDIPRVRFSANEEGPPRYSSQQFATSSQQQDGNLQIPPTIVISDADSKFVLLAPSVRFYVANPCFSFKYNLVYQK